MKDPMLALVALGSQAPLSTQSCWPALPIVYTMRADISMKWPKSGVRFETDDLPHLSHQVSKLSTIPSMRALKALTGLFSNLGCLYSSEGNNYFFPVNT